MGRRVARGAWFALVLLAACSCSNEKLRPGVVARLTDPDSVSLEPPLAVNERRLGVAARHAVALPVGSSFEMSVQGPLERIYLSLGVRLTTSPVRFSIRQRDGDRWRTIFVRVLGTSQEDWADVAVELRAGAIGRATFEFSTVVEEVAGRADVAADGAPLAEAGESLWGSVVFVGPRPSPVEVARPNVVLVSLDALGAAYLGSSGLFPGGSPQLDRVLGESFAFSRAFAQFGNTYVSHTSLFASLYPIRHGRYPGEPTELGASLVESLARNGYLTAAVTEDAYVGSAFGFARGFDSYDDGRLANEEHPATGNAAETFDEAIAWLESTQPKAPFFLFVHTYEVHWPYAPRDAQALAHANSLTPRDSREFPAGVRESNRLRRALYRGDPIRAGDFKRLEALHIGELHYLDRLLQGFLVRLAALDPEGNTLVVITSDHGDAFGQDGVFGHGRTLHNRVMQVPLAFYWPGRIAAGASASPVELVDVMPTILELAQIDLPREIDGRSLAPLVLGTAAIDVRPAFSEMRAKPAECAENACRVERYAVQTDRFKLVRARRARDYQRLYDLTADPSELRDVSARHADEVARLGAELDRYLGARRLAWGSLLEQDRGVDRVTRARLEALGYVD